jgi:predicted PurR-regulated permease PerM
MNEAPLSPSPKWNNTTKLVIGLTLAAILGLLVVSFRSIFALLLFAFILSYLLYPIANFLHRITRLPWRVVAAIIYLLMLFSLIGLLTWGGITLVEQFQNLVGFLQSALNDLPGFIQNFIAQPILIGPLKIDLTQVNLVSAVNTILGIIQPLLAQAGTLIGSLASSAASIIGWIFLSFLLSYFIISETGGEPGKLLNFQFPGYREDIKIISHELGIIWNAFLRGQVVVFFMVTLIYMVVLSILGVRYYFGLALLAGFSRFLPYVGGILSMTANGLVSLAQVSTIFGLSSPDYALMVVAIGWITDSIIDNMISPRIFSNALKIHPAAVLVTALVGYNILGIIGMILAAPVLATLKLLLDYTIRKMFDLDPWAGIVHIEPPPPIRVQLEQRGHAVWLFLKSISIRFYRWMELQTTTSVKKIMRR